MAINQNSKDDLIDLMASKQLEENGEKLLTKKQLAKAIELFEDSVVDILAKGEKLQLVGFLSVEPTGRSARKGRNPQTGEEIQIEASVSPKISAGKSLKKATKGLNPADFINKK